MALLNKEPTVILGAGAEMIRQVIPALVVFGFLNWTGEKTAAFSMIVGGAVTFLQVLLTRNEVVSNEKANAQIRTAIDMPATATVPQVIAKEKRQRKAKESQ